MRIKTDIILERFDRDHNLLERRVQPCKSFIKQLWELMYCQAAQINYATPRTGVIDIMGQQRAINGVSQHPDQYSDSLAKATLMAVAPGGNSMAYAPGSGEYGGNAAINFPLSLSGYMLRGEVLGICIGADNTAVAPNDSRLLDRYFHGTRAAVGVAASMQQHLGDTADTEVYQTSQKGALLTAMRGFKCASIKLKLYREGNPGILTLSLLGGSGRSGSTNVGPGPESGGTVIATATSDGDTLTNISPGEVREFTFATPVDIIPGMYYNITLTTVGGGVAQNVHWRYGVTNTRYALSYANSADGITWGLGQNIAPYYEMWGTANAEIEYGGCEVRNISVANPNASFILSRNFYNNSGGALSIEECGIQAAGFTNLAETLVYWRHDAFAFLIARDVIAPAINLLDTETLQVTYTPAITV